MDFAEWFDAYDNSYRLSQYMEARACGGSAWDAQQEIIDQRDTEIAALRALLDVSACPANCTHGACYDNYGGVEQCQFCYERKQILSATQTNNDEVDS